MSESQRRQIDHKRIEENGVVLYEYIYEVTKPNGEIINKIVRQRFSPTRIAKTDGEENREELVGLINRYLTDNNIRVQNLYKMQNLNNYLKPIQTYIIAERNIRLNQPILKQFIKREILLLEN